MYHLSRDVAVVTDASSGLGLRTQHGLADQSAGVGMLARREEELETAPAEVADK